MENPTADSAAGRSQSQSESNQKAADAAAW